MIRHPSFACLKYFTRIRSHAERRNDRKMKAANDSVLKQNLVGD